MLYKVGDKERSPKTAFLFSLQIALYQEFLLNKFLLDRLPGYGSFETKQSLIETARKMLDAILVLAANRDKLTNFSVGFVWAVGFSSTNTSNMILIKSQDHLQRYPSSCDTQCGAAKAVQISPKLAAGLTTLGNHSELEHLHRMPGMGSTD